MPDQATRPKDAKATSASGRPRDVVALQASLSRERLPKRLRAAARFLLDEPDFVALNPLVAISARSGVTGSTYVRLAQALGCAGFGDLRQILRDHLVLRSGGVVVGRESSRDAAAARLAPMVERIDRAMVRLLSAVDDGQLRHGADLLAGATTIYLVGARLAFPAILFINTALIRAGIKSIVVPSAFHDGTDSVDLADRGDAAVCVDFTPTSDETARLVDLLRHKAIPVLTITDDLLGQVARSSTLSFGVGDAQAPDVPHLAAAMALGALLATLVTERRIVARRWPAIGRLDGIMRPGEVDPSSLRGG